MSIYEKEGGRSPVYIEADCRLAISKGGRDLIKGGRVPPPPPLNEPLVSVLVDGSLSCSICFNSAARPLRRFAGGVQ